MYRMCLPETTSMDVTEKEVTWMAVSVAPKPFCTISINGAFTDVTVNRDAMGACMDFQVFAQFWGELYLNMSEHHTAPCV